MSLISRRSRRAPWRLLAAVPLVTFSLTSVACLTPACRTGRGRQAWAAPSSLPGAALRQEMTGAEEVAKALTDEQGLRVQRPREALAHIANARQLSPQEANLIRGVLRGLLTVFRIAPTPVWQREAAQHLVHHENTIRMEMGGQSEEVDRARETLASGQGANLDTGQSTPTPTGAEEVKRPLTLQGNVDSLSEQLAKQLGEFLTGSAATVVRFTFQCAGISDSDDVPRADLPASEELLAREMQMHFTAFLKGLQREWPGTSAGAWGQWQALGSVRNKTIPGEDGASSITVAHVQLALTPFAGRPVMVGRAAPPTQTGAEETAVIDRLVEQAFTDNRRSFWWDMVMDEGVVADGRDGSYRLQVLQGTAETGYDVHEYAVSVVLIAGKSGFTPEEQGRIQQYQFGILHEGRVAGWVVPVPRGWMNTPPVLSMIASIPLPQPLRDVGVSKSTEDPVGRMFTVVVQRPEGAPAAGTADHVLWRKYHAEPSRAEAVRALLDQVKQSGQPLTLAIDPALAGEGLRGAVRDEVAARLPDIRVKVTDLTSLAFHDALQNGAALVRLVPAGADTTSTGLWITVNHAPQSPGPPLTANQLALLALDGMSLLTSLGNQRVPVDATEYVGLEEGTQREKAAFRATFFG